MQISKFLTIRLDQTTYVGVINDYALILNAPIDLLFSSLAFSFWISVDFNSNPNWFSCRSVPRLTTFCRSGDNLKAIAQTRPVYLTKASL